MQRDDEAYEVIWLVRRLFRSMARRSGEMTADLGVSAADRAVLEFLHPDNVLSVPDIAERYEVSRQHVQVTVNRLLDAGLVSSRANPRHKRSPLIVSSGAGKTLFRKIRRREKREIARAIAPLATKDLHTTANTLRELLAQFGEEAAS